MPEDPGGEEAVEQGLHQRGLEEAFSFLVGHLQAEGVFHRFADRFHHLVRGGMFHTAAGIAGVAGQEPGDVLGIRQRRGAEQATAEKVEQPFAVQFGGFIGMLREAPEFLFVFGEAVVFVADGAALVVAADEQELAVVGDENLVVAVPILRDLLRIGDGEHVGLGRLALDDAASGSLARRRLRGLVAELVLGE